MLAHCIQELETRTSAEVVLVFRKCSGNYRDVDYLFGAGAAFAVLCFKLFAPWEFHPLSVPLPILLTFGLSALLSSSFGTYGPRGWLTRARRRHLQVRHAAAAYFEEQKIGRTQRQTGILLYYSALERRAELLAGEGAQQALSDRLDEFRTLLTAACERPRELGRSIEALAEFLRLFGVHLGHVLPHDPFENAPKPNELRDLPDIEGLDS